MYPNYELREKIKQMTSQKITHEEETQKLKQKELSK
jgi:hypothetical protein